MKIPRIPTPDGISGKQWNTEGKGSNRRPESHDPKFAHLAAELPRASTPGHTRIVYHKGIRTVWVNGVVTEKTEIKTGKSFFQK